MSTKLHVGNNWAVVLADDLEATSSQFGPAETGGVARDPGTGRGKGFAVVAMSKDEDPSAAIARLNFTQYAGPTIGARRFRAIGSWRSI
jgi:RNA recognition motif-containing protein